MDIVQRNVFTAFGKQHRFSSIDGLSSFKRNIPIREYDEYSPWLDRACNGEEHVLTQERILLFQPTGGTSSGFKADSVYTIAARGSFKRGINPWIFDLYRNLPGMLRGKGYWSITPKVVEENRHKEAGRPSDSKRIRSTWVVQERFWNRRLQCPPQ